MDTESKRHAARVLTASREYLRMRREEWETEGASAGYCPHGTYVGGCGIDWMCGPCEDGHGASDVYGQESAYAMTLATIERARFAADTVGMMERATRLGLSQSADALRDAAIAIAADNGHRPGWTHALTLAMCER